MKLNAKFLSRPKPVEWEFDGKKGKTYRINLMIDESEELAPLKVSEEFYMAIAENALVFGDMIAIKFAPKMVLSVQNGRAVQDLKIIPDSFEILENNTELAAD
jgi:hypothetical protein